MRILLINPSQWQIYGRRMAPAYPPLGLLYIAASLEESRQEVQFLDIDADEIGEKSLLSFLQKYNPELVGITAVTPTFKEALRISRIVKNWKEIPIILGGVHVTLNPEATLNHKEIDMVVIGEGEETVKELVERLERGEDLRGVKGLWFKSDGKIIKNPRRPLLENLDLLPFPARHLLKHPERYYPPDALHRPFISLLTSRGCPGKCTFCCVPYLYGQRVRRRGVKGVLAEIEEAINKYAIREVHIADDCFTSNKNWVKDYSREVKRKG